jgi:hypothetical protein
MIVIARPLDTYNDLGRFYKQFNKVTRTSPGRCRTLKAG